MGSCTERLLPGAGYRAAGCSQLSQPFTALTRLLKAEEQSLMPSPGSNPLLEHLLAVTWLDTAWPGATLAKANPLSEWL